MDGLIFVLMTMAAGFAAMFATDDAAKYLEPKTLWILKNIFIIIGATLLGLKQFRSTSYGDYRDKIKWVENGQNSTTKIQTTLEVNEKIPTNPAANISATAPPGV